MRRPAIPTWAIVAGMLGLTAFYFRKPAREALTMASNYQNARTNREFYAPHVRAAELSYGLPPGLLDRLILAESAYRDDIIKGIKRSSVGAVGIAQFMPATARELNIDPLNPYQSINAAALYLTQIRAFLGGDWKQTVAAYNWGMGNVKKVMQAHGGNWLAHVPTETKNYVAKITG